MSVIISSTMGAMPLTAVGLSVREKRRMKCREIEVANRNLRLGRDVRWIALVAYCAAGLFAFSARVHASDYFTQVLDSGADDILSFQRFTFIPDGSSNFYSV